ncbi:MAG: NUDIX hydrolase [Nitrososphaerota archaeon]|nr:NUDIX hydrolase [Nitrososphaerota archaeon]
MATNRKFAAFSKGSGPVPPFRMNEIPNGGLCLSAFLVFSRPNSQEILVGHLNPAAPWDHIGALDQSRIETHSKGWMLPSSHLMVNESPQDAARRIIREQLDESSITLSDPIVVSDVYTPKRFPNLPNHWDIEFIFKGECESLPRSTAWSELRYIQTSKMSCNDMARSHEDIVKSAGFSFADN